MNSLPLIVITGPTASGKSALALKLAQEYGGEIICADSRTVYKGLDIGTAKPTAEEQRLVPHHLLDVVAPNEAFSAADFQRLAREAIQDIRARGHIPFLVGGTGLYIDGILYDYNFNSNTSKDKREFYETLTIEVLQALCKKRNIGLPENSKNKRYLIRWLETNGQIEKSKHKLLDNTYVVAITTEKDILRLRIAQRAEHFLEQGVIEEAILLADRYGWESEAMKGNIYPLVKQLTEGVFTKNELIDKFTTLDWRLVKRQVTWLKRHHEVQWLSVEDAEVYIKVLLIVES